MIVNFFNFDIRQIFKLVVFGIFKIRKSSTLTPDLYVDMSCPQIQLKTKNNRLHLSQPIFLLLLKLFIVANSQAIQPLDQAPNRQANNDDADEEDHPLRVVDHFAN